MKKSMSQVSREWLKSYSVSRDVPPYVGVYFTEAEIPKLYIIASDTKRSTPFIRLIDGKRTDNRIAFSWKVG